jgi:hypothetical protein
LKVITNITVLIVLSSTLAMTALAQSPTAPPTTEVQSVTAPQPVAPAPAAPARLRIPEGTEVPLVFVDSISSATNGEGDRFTLRVDRDVKVGGQTVIKSGSIAVRTVTNARTRGYMGKAGELNVILSHVTVGDERIKLRARKGKTSILKPAHR